MKFRDILENENKGKVEPFEPNPLPYGFSDLEPNIDRETMKEHYEKHYLGYVKKLNKEFDNTPHLVKPLESILKNIRSYSPAVRNNGGGVHNHNHFWDIIKPGGSTKPTGELALSIAREWGGVGGFKRVFKKEGLKRFGSGWVWLSHWDGELKIHSTPNQDSPLMDGYIPIIGCDVWEHSYYLKWKSNREGWLNTFLEIINWDSALQNFIKK